MTTYDMIKALPGKTTNWTAVKAALRAMYEADGKSFDDSRFLCAGQKGVRADRFTAMEMACSIVRERSIRSSFIPPSPETLSWGGFLGGTSCVWTDQEVEEAVTVEVCNLIREAA